MVRVTGLLLVAAVALAFMSGCKSEKSRLEELFAKAGGQGGRGAVANGLRQEWAAKKVRMVEAVSVAHDKLDSPGDAAAVAFAGGVLDVISMAEPDLAKDTTEFFWTRVGTLAGKAAAVAAESGDIALARSLVLSGGTEWDDEAYWRQHPSHDALASMLMHKSGESKAALERLRSRPELTEETQAAYDVIEKEWRRASGG